MADEVSSIGVKLSLNASSFMTGMTAATERTESFIAVAKEAQTVAGAGAGSKGPSTMAAPKMAPIKVDLSVSKTQIDELRREIISGLGTINIKVHADVARGEAERVVAAQATPVIGTRQGAATVVRTNVKRNLPGRAAGGPVGPGQDYLVGERRPEVVRFAHRGTVIPDAERFYREQEQEARRANDMERRHLERMNKLQYSKNYVQLVERRAAAEASSQPASATGMMARLRGMMGRNGGGPVSRGIRPNIPIIRSLKQLESFVGSAEGPLYSRWTPNLRRDMQPGQTSGVLGARQRREAGISVHQTPLVEDYLVNPFYDLGPARRDWDYRLEGTSGAGVFEGPFKRRNLYLLQGQQVPGLGTDGEPLLEAGSIRPVAAISRKAVNEHFRKHGAAKGARTKALSERQLFRAYGISPTAGMGDYDFKSRGAGASRPLVCPSCGLVNWSTAGGPRSECAKCGSPLGKRAQGGYATWAQSRHESLGGTGRLKIGSAEEALAIRGGEALDVFHELGRGRPQTAGHKAFYDIERRKIEARAKQLGGVTGKQLIDVVAALSSNQKWEDNVEAGVTAIQAVRGQGPAGFANREQLDIVQRILAGQRVTGVKRLPFADAFYDPNAFPIDRWMGRITTLGMKSGTGLPTDAMSVMKALRGKDWTADDVPSPSVRRASVYAIDQAAGRWGMSPREAQAEPWGTVRDLAKEAVGHFRLDKKTGLAVPRHGGGPVHAAGGTRTWMKGTGPVGSPDSPVPPLSHAGDRLSYASIKRSRLTTEQAVAAIEAHNLAFGGQGTKTADVGPVDIISDLQAAADAAGEALAAHRTAAEAKRQYGEPRGAHKTAQMKYQKAQSALYRAQAEAGIGEPLAAFMHITGGGWRWAEAEDAIRAGKEYPSYGGGQGPPGFFNYEQAPFRNLYHGPSTWARSFLIDKRFEHAWQSSFNDIYGNMGDPSGRTHTGLEFRQYLTGKEPTTQEVSQHQLEALHRRQTEALAAQGLEQAGMFGRELIKPREDEDLEAIFEMQERRKRLLVEKLPAAQAKAKAPAKTRAAKTPTGSVVYFGGKRYFEGEPGYEEAVEKYHAEVDARYEARWGPTPELTPAQIRKQEAYKARGLTERGGQDIYRMVGAGSTTPEQHELAVKASEHRMAAMARLERMEAKRAAAALVPSAEATAAKEAAFDAEVEEIKRTALEATRRRLAAERSGAETAQPTSVARKRRGSIDPAAKIAEIRTNLAALPKTAEWKETREQLERELAKLLGEVPSSVPQHEAPEVAAHQAVMAHHEAAKTEEEVVAETVARMAAAAAPAPRPPTQPPRDIPNLFTVRRRTRQPEEDFEQQIGMRVPWLKRRAGGDAGNGLYVVNELGPEAFIEGKDIGKLRARRPDIYKRIPGAHDGTKTGMIDKPAWGMFAPQKDGLIVRREDAMAALGAVRAARGSRGPEEADEDIRSPGPVLRAGTAFVPTGSFEALHRRTRTDAEVEQAKALRVSTEQINAFTAALKEPSRQLSAGEPIAGLLAAGPPPGTTIPLGGPTTRPSGHGTIYGMPPGAPAGGFTPPPAGPAWAGTPPPGGAFRPTPGYPGGPTWAGGGGPRPMYGPPAPTRPDLSLNAEEARSRAEGARQVELERLASGRPSRETEALERVRAATAASRAAQAPGLPKRAFAQLGQLFFGGGEEMRKKQAELTNSTYAYNAALGDAAKAAEAAADTEAGIEVHRGKGEDVQHMEKTLAMERKAAAGSTKALAEAETRMNAAAKDVEPSFGSVARSFGSIVASTTIFGATLAVTNKVLDAAMPALQGLADEVTGFGATSQRVTKLVGTSARDMGGNVEAALASAVGRAGVGVAGGGMAAQYLTGGAIAKGGGLAAQEGSDLYKAIAGAIGGAPEGLLGGYGGIGGGGFLAEALGGGKGSAEIMTKTLSSLMRRANRNTMVPGVTSGASGIVSDLDLMGMDQDTITRLREAAGTKPGAGLVGPSTVSPAFKPDPDRDKFLKLRDAAVKDYNDATQRYTKRIGEADTGLRLTVVADEEQLKAQGDAALAAAELAQATDGATEAENNWADRVRDSIKGGAVLLDAQGNVVDTLEEFTKYWEQVTAGGMIPTTESFVAQQREALVGRRQIRGAQAARQVNVELPFNVTKQLLAQPQIQPGVGFFPGGAGGGIGAAQIAKAGLSGGAASATLDALSSWTESQAALGAIATDGLAKARQEIMNYGTGTDLADFDAATAAAQGVSTSIADMTTKMMKLNQEASQANWNNQLRLANRALADVLALQGKSNKSRLGALEREQHLIQRASQALDLALKQRQITTQIALAGFQAPGETGEERYMRQKERLAEADIAQQQLNFSFREFTVSGNIWKENLKRAEADARASIDVMTKARNAEGYAIVAQGAIASKSAELAIHIGKMDIALGKSRDNWSDALSVAGDKVTQFGGAIDDVLAIVMPQLGYKQNRSGTWTRSGAPAGSYGDTSDQRGVLESSGYMGRHASGYIGAFKGGATFTVGEAGPETVAILRNPRTHMLQGEGGGAAPNVTVNINGPVVRDDHDLEQLAHRVATEVERSLSRKGQMLGLRQPAY